MNQKDATFRVVDDLQGSAVGLVQEGQWRLDSLRQGPIRPLVGVLGGARPAPQSSVQQQQCLAMQESHVPRLDPLWLSRWSFCRRRALADDSWPCLPWIFFWTAWPRADVTTCLFHWGPPSVGEGSEPEEAWLSSFGNRRQHLRVPQATPQPLALSTAWRSSPAGPLPWS